MTVTNESPFYQDACVENLAVLRWSHLPLTSTHVFSDMASLRRTRLMGVAIKRFLTQLKRHARKAYELLDEQLRRRYTPGVNQLFGDKRAQRFSHGSIFALHGIVFSKLYCFSQVNSIPPVSILSFTVRIRLFEFHECVTLISCNKSGPHQGLPCRRQKTTKVPRQ